MRICFINNGRSDDSIAKNQSDIYCFDFSFLGEVSYERELEGKSNQFEKLAVFSKRANALAVSGCYTDIRGVRRKSIAVADRGRLLFVADMNSVTENKRFKSGTGLKMIGCESGKIGLIVSNDLLFPEYIKSLTDCGSDIIICVGDCVGEGGNGVLARAYSRIYGVDVFFNGRNYSLGAGVNGEMSFATGNSPFVYDFDIKKSYKNVEYKRRGI